MRYLIVIQVDGEGSVRLRPSIKIAETEELADVLARLAGDQDRSGAAGASGAA